MRKQYVESLLISIEGFLQIHDRIFAFQDVIRFTREKFDKFYIVGCIYYFCMQF